MVAIWGSESRIDDLLARLKGKDKLVLGGIAGLALLGGLLQVSDRSNAVKQITGAPSHLTNLVMDSIVYGRDKYRKELHTGNGYETFLDVAHRDPQLASFTRYVNGIGEGAIVVPSGKPIYTFVLDPEGKTIHQWADEFEASKASATR